MYRQGDVLIVPLAEAAVPETAAGATPEPRDARGRLVLALGEVTGHAHAVVGPGSTGCSVSPTSIFRTAGGWCTRSTRRYRCPRAGTAWCDSVSTCPVRCASWRTEKAGERHDD